MATTVKTGHSSTAAHDKQQPKTHLKHVDYYFGVSSYDFGWVIQNDIPILAPGDQDSGDSLTCSHAVRPPDQLVVPARQTDTGCSHPLP